MKHKILLTISLICLSCGIFLLTVNAETSYNFLTKGFADTLYCSLFGCNITGNLVVSGNFSAKRPYWTGYDNETQNFVNTALTQIINVSNNNDYDAYLIAIEARQNLTFQQTGDYLCILSPEFYQATGSNKVITFWFQKTNSTGQFNDVAWTNSRYTMQNAEYTAPAIPFQFDITNPSKDKVRFMWYSDSTASQIVSISGLTSPTRPSIPAIILNCQKVSEITP